MATMRAYTTIEQSRKLAEILPLESTNMYWKSLKLNGHISWTSHIKRLEPPFYDFEYYAPCWSLAALLDVLESEINSEDGKTYQLNIEKDGTWWYITYLERYGESNDIETKPTEELIDACYEMILKLKELNLL